jgi:hypothetical protein
MRTTVPDDQILPITRIVLIAVITVLLGAFFTLYFFPGQTDRLFAWTIKPRMTPLLMGAGYLGGVYSFSRAQQRRTKWHHVGLAFLPVVVFASDMAAATALHWDKFNHSHIWFWIWVIVYATTPWVVLLLWLGNRGADPKSAEPDDVAVPRLVRAIVLIAGIFQLALAAYMFFLPASAISIWPWAITPLTSRVIAGWFGLTGASAVMISRDSRWSSSRIPIEATLVFSGLLLIGIARAWTDFDSANPLTWGYLALVSVTFFGFLILYLALEAQRRRARRARAEAVRPAA